MELEIEGAFEKLLKYAIVEMKLHGEFPIGYGKTEVSLSGIQATILHILDFDPCTQRPKTEYADIHSVHASLDSLLDMVNIITDNADIDWHRPFGHETNHLYASYVDKDGVTKYLVLSAFTML